RAPEPGDGGGRLPLGLAMKILDRLPLSVGYAEVLTPDGMAEVRPYQIVVMVSLAAQEIIELPEGASRFPAILDTGNNHNFAIQQEQFERWTGFALPRRGQVSIGSHI